MITWVHLLPSEKISRATFDALPEYSCSVPTVVTLGKVWKRDLGAYDRAFPRGTWVLCEYVADEKPGYVKVECRRPLIVENVGGPS